MFHIIGGDGKEYGPVTVAQIRAWIAAGRANLDTKAKALGTDEWRRLADFGEFASPDGAPPVIDAPLGGDPALASCGARTGAALINAIIYFIAMMPGSMMMSARLLKQNPHLAAQSGLLRPGDLNLEGLADSMLWVKAGLGLAMLLQVVLIAWRGQNIGKLLCSIRVVRVADGQRASFVPGVIWRYLLPVVTFFLLNGVFPLLGFVFLIVDYGFMFREDRRCLHDLIAGTKVVKA